MSQDAVLKITYDCGGLNITKTITRSGDHPNPYSPTLPPGTAGTLSTRTDDDTGVVTASGHSLQVADRVDVYWDGGKRYGMLVSAVSGDDVTVGTGVGDVGAGDAFPAADTAVVITKAVEINTAIDGDTVKILVICAEGEDGSTAKAHITMEDSSAAEIEAIDLAANEPRIFDITGGAANVFTGNPITKSYASNGSSTETLTLKLASMDDSTP